MGVDQSRHHQPRARHGPTVMLGSAARRPDVDDAATVDVDDARTPDAPRSVAGDDSTGGQPRPPGRASFVTSGHAGMVATRTTTRAWQVPPTPPAPPAPPAPRAGRHRSTSPRSSHWSSPTWRIACQQPRARSTGSCRSSGIDTRHAATVVPCLCRTCPPPLRPRPRPGSAPASGHSTRSRQREQRHYR